MNWINRLLIFLGISLTVYFLIIGFIFLSPTISNYLDQKDFDKKTWIEWEENETTIMVRWNMVDDLTENYDLKGKNRTEIKGLLGEPSRENDNEMSYFLGMTGHGINTGNLTIELKNDHVIEFYISQG